MADPEAHIHPPNPQPEAHTVVAGIWNYYVSSVRGDDSNGGTEIDEAFASFDALPSLTSSDVVAVDRGTSYTSHIGEELTGTRLRDYGNGDPPTVDLRDPFDASAWQTTSYTDVYKQTVTNESVVPNAFTRRVWDQDDTELISRQFLSNVESDGGFHVDTGGADPVYYVQTPGKEDLTAGNHTVYYAARGTLAAYGIQDAGGGKVEFFHALHPLANAGHVQLEGGSSKIDRCVFVDGGKHHVVAAGGTIRDTVMIEAVPNDVRSRTGKSIIAFFSGAQFTAGAQDYRLERVIFRDAAGQAYVGHSVPSGSTLTIRGHVIDNLDLGGKLPDISVDWEGGYVNRCKIPGEANTVKYLMYDGREVTDTTQPLEKSSTIEQSAIHGKITRSPENATFTLRHCIVWGFDGGLNGFANLNNNTINYDFENCILLGVSSLQDHGGTIRLRRCVMYHPVNEAPTEESLSTLKTDHDVDNSNAFVTSDQLESLFNGDITAPLSGDHTIDETADVTESDGTVHSGQLPDGTSLSEVGVTKRWSWTGETSESGRPTQWPTPPGSESEGVTYVKDPSGWDWKGTPEDNVQQITNIGDHAWTMDEAAGNGEPDEIASISLDVNNGSPGSGTIGSTPARTFGGGDDFNTADNVVGAGDIWCAALMRIDTLPSNTGAGSINAFLHATATTGWQIKLDTSTDEFVFIIRDAGGSAGTKKLKVAPSEYTVGSAFILQWWTNRNLAEHGIRIDDTEHLRSDATINGPIEPDNSQRNEYIVGQNFEGAIGPHVVSVGTKTQKTDRDWVYNGGDYRTISEIQAHEFDELIFA